MGETVLYESGDGVATLTLNRPDRLNTIVPELIGDLRAGLERAWADADVRAIRLRGAGRVFCAGYDIDWGSESMLAAEGEETWDPIAEFSVFKQTAQGTVWTALPFDVLPAAPGIQADKLKLALNRELDEQLKTFRKTDFVWNPMSPSNTPIEQRKSRDWRSCLSGCGCGLRLHHRRPVLD